MTTPTTPPRIGNIAPPVKLSNVALDGVAKKSSRAGEPAEIWVRLSLTSDDLLFHRVAEGLVNIIAHHAKEAGASIPPLHRADTVLLVIHLDNTADLWVDSAAVAVQAITRRSIAGPSIVTRGDIADVIGMSFPAVTFTKEDRVVCLFRVDWSFGLYFDFNPERDLDVPGMERELGTLRRVLSHRLLYDTLTDVAVYDRIIAAGWFPFAELLPDEFRSIADTVTAGFELADVEAKLIESFDTVRLDHLLARWLAKPHFAAKEILLRSAIKNFVAKDPVAVLKTVLTEIEGILRDAHRAARGAPAKLPVLLAFAKAQATTRTGGLHTLLFAEKFAEYLEAHTFGPFDPLTQSGVAGSRHAVGHGEAKVDTYTMVRALQALLTLDQFAFYI